MICPTPPVRSFGATGSVILLLLASLSASCGSERRYEVRGRVAGFGDDDRTLIVEHEAIRGLMPAMTMPFQTLDSASADSLAVGDAVAFVLVLQSDRSWITDVRRLPADAVVEHPAGQPDAFHGSRAPLIERGDTVPDTEFTTQADTTLRLSDLRGRRVFLTFMYTECPVPDFCPLMSRQFAALQSRLEAMRRGDGSEDEPPVHLLSVSFDPDTDTPAVLRAYAARYTHDLSNWTFATGDSAAVADFAARFGVFYRGASDQIIHNLVTAFIDEHGTVRAIWRGNEWRPDDLVGALRGV